MFKYVEKQIIKKVENDGTYDVIFYKLAPDKYGIERGWIHDFNDKLRKVPTIKDHSIVKVADIVVHMECAKMIDALEERGKAFKEYDRNDGLLQYTKQKIEDIKNDYPELFSEEKPRLRRMSASSEECLERIKRHFALCCAPENEVQKMKRKKAAMLERHLNDHQSYELNDEQMRRNVQDSDNKVREYEGQILAEGKAGNNLAVDTGASMHSIVTKHHTLLSWVSALQIKGNNFDDGSCKRSLEAGAGNVDNLSDDAAVRRFLPRFGGGKKKNHDEEEKGTCENASSDTELRMPANCAFVTFNNAMDCSHVLRDVRRKKAKGILYEEYKPEEAPEPDDIIFENLQVDKAERFQLVRRNYLIILGLLIATGAATTVVRIIYYLQEAKKREHDEMDGLFHHQSWNRTIYDHCASIGFQAWHEKECGNISKGYIHERLMVAGIILACNVFVSGVNLFLKFIIRLRVKKEKHETVSKAAVSEMRAVFLAQYINTCVLVGIFGGPNVVEKGMGKLMALDWYLDNGTSVFTVCLINSVADEIEVRLRMLKKEWDKRKGIQSARTQEELNEAYRYM